METTSFVGRRHDLSNARGMLSRSRLLTVSGVAGVGKTRLAQRLADQTLRLYANGVRFVDLAALPDEHSLLLAVAEAFGLDERSADSGAKAVAGVLADAQALLVLDNCEHLPDACAELAAALLRMAPGMRILATSRRVLRVAGEHVLLVTGLPVPPDAASEAVQDCEAMRLFADRAAAAEPGFRIDAGNRATVAELCRRLEGNPLRIELAAGQLSALTVEQIVRRLADPELLATTLLDSSYELCSPDARRLWARLSVFVGDFDLSAAEAICAGNGIDDGEVLDLVAGLIDDSILVREQHGANVRFRLPEMVREYGRCRLRAYGEEAALTRRHRDWYLSLTTQAEAEWVTPLQRSWFAQLHADQRNIVAALDFCLSDQDEAQAGVEAAAALLYYWIASGQLDEGRRLLKQALTLCPVPSQLHTRALRAAGILALFHNDLTAGLTFATACEDAAQELGDRSLLAYAAQCRGLGEICRGQPQRANTLLTRARAEHRALQDDNGALSSLVLLGMAASLAGDYDRAVALGEECFAESQECGETWYRSYALWVRAHALAQRGDLPQAVELSRQSLRFSQDFHDWLCVELCMRVLGSTKQARGLSYQETIELGLRETGKKPASKRPENDDAQVLTCREQEIAGLIAKGMSNKQIAATLVISQRTAEMHVEHILTKLGFSSRVQVASWLVRNHALAS